jgi:hypothetical protein
LVLTPLAGCSGGSQKPAALGTSGASTTSAVTGSATTSAATTQPVANEPSFNLPADLTVTIDPDTTGDPVKDAVLATNGRFFKAYFEAITSGNVNDPLLLRYATPAGAATWQEVIKTQRAQGLTVTGTIHYYRRQVSVKDQSLANMSVCEDQSQLFDKEIKTGNVHRTSVSDADYVLLIFSVIKGADGSWQMASSLTHQGDAAVKQECR